MIELLSDKDNWFVFVFLIGGLFGLIWGMIKRKRSIRITGEIVEYYQNSQLHYVPVMQFENENKSYQLKLDRGFRRKLAREGQLLEIYFMPSNKEYVKLVGDRRDVWYSLLLLCLGVISIFFLTI